jgi:hypothetical protein
MKVFRIRKSTDSGFLYSTGNTVPHWTKSGKFWKNEKDLIRHLKLIESNTERLPEYHPYIDCEIVACELKDELIDRVDNFWEEACSTK